MANWGRLRQPRVGVMLHYDGSASDAGAVAWLTRDPAARVSYSLLVLDDGQVVTVAPIDARAWHAGSCRPSSSALKYRDANSAFYGVALAARPGDTLTDAQVDALGVAVRRLFASEGWPLADAWRLTDHAAEAWPRGRKVDLGRGLLYRGAPFTLSVARNLILGGR